MVKKSHKRKNNKPLIVATILVLTFGIAGTLYLYVYRGKATPEEVKKTDTELLVAHSWEKDGAPSVIWTFHEDGTGEITTNKSNYYDMTWSFSSSTNNYLVLDSLTIKTAWLYDLEDRFTYEFIDDNLKVVDSSDDTESLFLPLGTQSEAEEFETDEAETIPKE